jgi:hypothetical protein
MLWVINSWSFWTFWNRTDSPWAKHRLVSRLLKWNRPLDSCPPTASARSLSFGSGPSPSVEDADRVVEDRVEELVLALQVDQVVPGPQQGEELVAGPRHAVAAERHPPDALVVRRPGRGGDDELVRRGAVEGRVHQLDQEGHLAELHHVPRLEREVLGPDAGAVDVGAVGALQVADRPVAVQADADLGVLAADGAVVEDDLQRGEPAGAQQRIVLPDVALDRATDAPESNDPLHRKRPSRGSGFKMHSLTVGGIVTHATQLAAQLLHIVAGL